MKLLNKIWIALFVAVSMASSSYAGSNFGNETLNYVITYKWGLISKDTGDATLTLKNQGSKYYMKLCGKTRRWADKFFIVRDTLTSVVEKSTFRPLSYSRIAHENGRYYKDDMVYSYSGNSASGKIDRRKEHKGKVTESSHELSANGQVLDMVSIFYWIRIFDPATMAVGEKKEATLFSGSDEQKVTLLKVGEDEIKMRDGTRRPAWHMRYSFKAKAGKKGDDNIEVWVSKDDQRVPLEVRGALSVGRVIAYLVTK